VRAAFLVVWGGHSGAQGSDKVLVVNDVRDERVGLLGVEVAIGLAELPFNCESVAGREPVDLRQELSGIG